MLRKNYMRFCPTTHCIHQGDILTCYKKQNSSYLLLKAHKLFNLFLLLFKLEPNEFRSNQTLQKAGTGTITERITEHMMSLYWIILAFGLT